MAKMLPSCRLLEGTIDAVNDNAWSTSVRHSRCHLWEEIHRRLPSISAVKVKAHLPFSAVSEGRISEYEWNGNRAADVYAGREVTQHPDTSD
eukprot:1329932-Pyramimonas_sp.AAC.1